MPLPLNKHKIFNKAKEVIVKHNLFFVEDLVAYLPCSKSWFYEHFKNGMEEMDKLKDLLYENRTKMRVRIRKKLFDSNDIKALSILYKSVAEGEERGRIWTTNIETNQNVVQTVIERKIISNSDENKDDE